MYKVCIVDDEPYIRTSLKHRLSMAPEDLICVGEAGNEHEAIELFHRIKPDILFVDIRMPGKSGLELIHALQNLYPDQQPVFIIVSGYDDFSYMQQAIKLGVNNYLKKPIAQEEFDEAVLRAVQTLKEQEANAAAQDAEAINYESFVKRVYPDAPPSQTALLIACRNPQLKTIQSKCPQIACDRMHIVKLQWGDSIRLYYFENIQNPQRALQQAQQLSPFCDLLVHCLIRTHAPIYAIKKADAAMNRRFAASKRRVVALDLENEPSSQPVDLESLRVALQHKEKSYCRQFLRELFEKLASTEQTARGIRHTYKDIIMLILSLHHNPPAALELELFPFATGRFYTLEQLYESLWAYCEDLIEFFSQTQKSNELVDMVCDYLQKHYMNELSLQDVANNFFVSPNYLCTRFKEKKQITLTAYLEKLRMDKSVTLLSSTTISISEICQLIGYNDLSYFARVFKKHYGITPSQYRKKDGNI